MTDRSLSLQRLNRALLARQLLLERSSLSIPDALSQVGGLQTQYAPSGYVGLWTRLADFRRDDLTRALEDRSVVQATLMRVTIHLVAASDYWRFEIGVKQARQEWARRVNAAGLGLDDPEGHAVALRRALANGPRSVADIGGLASGFIGNVGLWVDLVRVPPSGTWARRRADILALADDWVGPASVTADEGLEHLVGAYLRGFGPAPVKDISSWAGVSAAALKAAAERLDLVRYHDDRFRELLDLPDAPLPDADTHAPVRFLPHWDASLLVHARRAGILPEEHRPRVFSSRNPFSVGVYLVDGRVAGAWSVKDGHVRTNPFEELPARVVRQVNDEAERLDAFHQ
jgi:hypothetical protein